MKGTLMTKINEQNVLLCYLDEAGTTNFDETGSRFFLYTALVLEGDGFPLHRALLECRYEVIASQGRFSNSHEGNDYFHATEDSLGTRAQVFPVLKDRAKDARVYSLVVDKAALPEEFRTQEGLFEHAATTLLQEVWKVEGMSCPYDRIIVMLDSIPVQRRRRAILGAIKHTLGALLKESDVAYSVMPMSSKSELCLQAVDYYSWALYRKWERGDPTQLERLGDNIVVIDDIISKK